MINTENLPNIFNYYPPKSPFKGILSIPHSGEHLPSEFTEYLTDDLWDLKQDIDYKVHELVDINTLQESGIAVLYSNIIRTAIDLNREKSKACLNWKSNSKGIKLVLKEPDQTLESAWLEKYYSPYYEMLKTLILELQNLKELPSLVDLHSMPTKAEKYHLDKNPDQDPIRPNFCISDRHGLTCEKEFIEFIGNELKNKGYSVKYNNPYIGGNITGFLHETYTPLNNIQIEISRSVYMNEDNKDLRLKEFNDLKKNITNSLINLFNQFG